MQYKQAVKSVLCSALAAAGLVAVTAPAEAGPVRVRFTPPYGAPFDTAGNGAGNELGWGGEAIVDDGACVDTGTVSNLSGPCAGQFTFTSAVVNLYNVSAPTVSLQSINFTGGAVTTVERSSTTTANKIYSQPFNAGQGSISESQYLGGSQAWFSLVFVGAYAQLYWFKNNPGNWGDSPETTNLYLQCALAGSGDNSVLGNNCGLSSNLDGKGALLEITPVPEPATYALMLAGLATLAGLARRRKRGE